MDTHLDRVQDVSITTSIEKEEPDSAAWLMTFNLILARLQQGEKVGYISQNLLNIRFLNYEYH